MNNFIRYFAIVTLFFIVAFGNPICAQTACIQIKAIDIQEDAAKKESIERQNRRKLLIIEAAKEKNRRKLALKEEFESKISDLRKELVRRESVIDDEYCEL